MKTFLLITIVILALIAVPATAAAATALDISLLKSVPEKNYLVTLELNGGQFQPHPRQPGVFAVTFQTPRGAMTQIWIFRPDGTAAIRENPDRGEQQSAVPVTGDSIELPAAKR